MASKPLLTGGASAATAYASLDSSGGGGDGADEEGGVATQAAASSVSSQSSSQRALKKGQSFCVRYGRMLAVGLAVLAVLVGGAAALALLLPSTSGGGNGPPAPGTGRVRHVVVLMLENRSFDHVLGWMRAENREVDGLNGTEVNYLVAGNASTTAYQVSQTQPYLLTNDPPHTLEATAAQIYNVYPPPSLPLPGGAPAPMGGFAELYAAQNGDPALVMAGFSADAIPVTAQLARTFAVADRFFASFPGPTWPNRRFLFGATSQGMSQNAAEDMAAGMTGPSIFQLVADAGLDWSNYFFDTPTSYYLTWVRAPAQAGHLRYFDEFLVAAAAGTLPALSFIDPRYADSPWAAQNDNHPGKGNVANGEALLKTIYEALRAGPGWEHTLLVVTYDEHGGFYDHVPPPDVGVPNPDSLNATDPPFDFTRLGIRVPTLLVSPLIPAGAVLHAPPEGPARPTNTSQYEFSSIGATVRKLLGITSAPFFSARDAWAGTFEGLLSLPAPRTDCPATLVPAPTAAAVADGPVDGLQHEMVALAAAVAGVPVPPAEGLTEFDASTFIKEQVSRALGRCPYAGADLFDGVYCRRRAE